MPVPLDETKQLGDTGQFAIVQGLIARANALDNRVITTDHTLELGDANQVLEVDSADTREVTVPLNSSVAFPIGTVVVVFQMGDGTVAIIQSAGVSMWRPGGLLGSVDVAAKYGEVSLRKRDTDIWVVGGNWAEFQ